VDPVLIAYHSIYSVEYDILLRVISRIPLLHAPDVWNAALSTYETTHGPSLGPLMLMSWSLPVSIHGPYALHAMGHLLTGGAGRPP